MAGYWVGYQIRHLQTKHILFFLAESKMPHMVCQSFRIYIVHPGYTQTVIVVCQCRIFSFTAPFNYNIYLASFGVYIIYTKYASLKHIFQCCAVNVGIDTMFADAVFFQYRAADDNINTLLCKQFIHTLIKPLFDFIIKQNLKMLLAFPYIA